MRTRTVLVVEDDPAILIEAVSVFEDAGVPVLSFENADDTLAYMYEHADSVSAIFTDMQMPGYMDGLTLAEVVDRHWPRVTVILTSGRVRPIAPLPRNVRFLPKPWLPQQVLAELQDAVDAMKAMPP